MPQIKTNFRVDAFQKMEKEVAADNAGKYAADNVAPNAEYTANTSTTQPCFPKMEK